MNLGLYFTKPISRINNDISIRTGILVVSKGYSIENIDFATYDGIVYESDFTGKLRYYYNQIPVEINFEIYEEDKVKVDVFGGVFISLLREIVYDIESHEIGLIGLDFEESNTDLPPFENEIELGISIGADFKYKIYNNNDLGIRYSYQLGQMVDFIEDEINSTHVITVYYQFDI